MALCFMLCADDRQPPRAPAGGGRGRNDAGKRVVATTPVLGRAQVTLDDNLPSAFGEIALTSLIVRNVGLPSRVAVVEHFSMVFLRLKSESLSMAPDQELVRSRGSIAEPFGELRGVARPLVGQMTGDGIAVRRMAKRVVAGFTTEARVRSRRRR